MALWEKKAVVYLEDDGDSCSDVEDEEERERGEETIVQ